ncbi:MAG: hypothetical protein WBX38_01595 [Candidatus Sulfotelmatobacter sp.]
MAVERIEFSTSPGSEPAAPVSGTPAVQGRAARGDAEGTPRRRAPPPEETAEAGDTAATGEKTVDESMEETEDLLPVHRIDSLA